MQPSDDAKKSWMASEDQLWADVRRQERRRRDFFWILIGSFSYCLAASQASPAASTPEAAANAAVRPPHLTCSHWHELRCRHRHTRGFHCDRLSGRPTL